jgi:hypothetical protein
MDPTLEITPDMTPEEIDAIQNPGGGSTLPEPIQDPAPHHPADDQSLVVNPGPNDSSVSADPSMTGRMTAAEQRASEALTRANMLEQNNRFLEQRAADAAAAAEAAKAEAQKHREEAQRLQEQISQATAPKLADERRQHLIDLHGESGAQPLIDLEERLLATEAKYTRIIDDLKKNSGSLPDLVSKELDKRNTASAASAFNEALMTESTGIPDLPTLVKDARFTEFLRADPYGLLATYNSAIQSNDVKAIPVLKGIVDKYRGNPSSGVDSGTGGRGGNGGSSRGTGTVATQEQAVTEWNRLLDAGDFESAQAHAKKHKLHD